MTVIIKTKNLYDLKFTEKVCAKYLSKYPKIQRITIDFNKPEIIEVYSKGGKDTILFRRKQNV